jgi:hypothetical protein
MKQTVLLEIDTISGAARIGGGFSVSGAMKRFSEIVNRNARIPWNGGRNADAKAKLSLEAARFYRDELAPQKRSWDDMTTPDIAKAVELEAADYTDPNNELGTLSGTLVMQETLPLFAYDYPELAALWSDFSAEAGLLNQTADTRIVTVPALQKYNATLDANGRPLGFAVVSAA